MSQWSLGPTLDAFLLDFTEKIRIVVSCPNLSDHRKMSLKGFWEDSKITLFLGSRTWGSKVHQMEFLIPGGVGKPRRVASLPVNYLLFVFGNGPMHRTQWGSTPRFLLGVSGPRAWGDAGEDREAPWPSVCQLVNDRFGSCMHDGGGWGEVMISRGYKR